ncbi:MAG: EamA family transporter RarD [Haliangium ochraceum]
MPAPAPGGRARAGVFYSLAAYTCWGLFPLYLWLVRDVGPVEFLLHRMVWSVLFVFGILAARRQWDWLRAALRSPAVMGRFVASAMVLSLNWFVFVWAVHVGRVVDASLGYFINPLLTIALGAAFLKERLRPVQLGAVGLALGGVLWLAFQIGQAPWIGLALAASFGTYGLLRKTAPLGAIEGLALETLVLSPFAVGALGWLAAHGQSRFVGGGARLRALVLLAGPVTTVPLLLFAAGARRIPLSALGLLQYIGPTLQLLVGVVVLREPFVKAKLVGYAFIWLACAIASADGVYAARRAPS